MRKRSGQYPDGWPEFARQLKSDCNWACIRCGHPHDPSTGHTLTVHHATMAKGESFDHWWAFWVLCQRCHLRIQGKVDLERPWIFEHSQWARPLIAGFYAWKYLGLTLSRPEVESRLDELLALESQAVLGMPPLALT